VLSTPVNSPFPRKSIWRVKAPLKVVFFVWTMTLGKILTLDNLRKRNVIVVDWCYMYKKSGESIDHLILHCKIARELWNSLFHLFGVNWVMPRRMREFVMSWRWQMGTHNILEVWRLAPSCLI
jgi:hypothetical protein